MSVSVENRIVGDAPPGWRATEESWRPGTLRDVNLDLQQNPLGSRRGENFDVPVNFRMPDCRVYMVNHSRVRPWRRIVVAVSSMRGAEEALVYDKALAKVYNVDTLLARVQKGFDMNRYETSVKPVAFKFEFGGKPFIIPPAKTADEAPPRIEVPEGCWDLFLGNFERLVLGFRASSDGKPFDNQDINAERVWLSKRWSRRSNPVFMYQVDGKTKEVHKDGKINESGFIEFVRETQHVGEIPLDREYLSAIDLLEV